MTTFKMGLMVKSATRYPGVTPQSAPMSRTVPESTALLVKDPKCDENFNPNAKIVDVIYSFFTMANL